jgi:hypothetical protein
MNNKNNIDQYINEIDFENLFKFFLWKGESPENYHQKINDEKTQLKERLSLLLNLDVKVYRSKYWKISKGKYYKLFNNQIEIEFIPYSKSISTSLNGSICSNDMYSDVYEWHFLLDLASRYSITNKYKPLEMLKNLLKSLMR